MTVCDVFGELATSFCVQDELTTPLSFMGKQLFTRFPRITSQGSPTPKPRAQSVHSQKGLIIVALKIRVSVLERFLRIENVFDLSTLEALIEFWMLNLKA